MDTHTRVAAVLHIVYGALGAGFLLIAMLIASGVAAFAPGIQLPAFVWALGTWIFAVLMLLPIAEIIAGIYLLKGTRTARAFVIVFGVLDLIHFPVGTVLGIYTLWALLRTQPVAVVVLEKP